MSIHTEYNLFDIKRPQLYTEIMEQQELQTQNEPPKQPPYEPPLKQPPQERLPRMRASTISYIGQFLFGTGALALWVTAAYFSAQIVGMILGGLGILIGLFLSAWSDRHDMKIYKQLRRETPNLLPPHSVFALLGGFLIGLGGVGLVFIIVGNEWSNTAWVVVEIFSLVGGVVMAGFGVMTDVKRKQEFDLINS